MREIVPGIRMWRMWSGEKGYFFNGWILSCEAGEIVVDPPPLSEEAHAAVLSLRNPLGVLLTNWTHRRFAADVVRLRSMPILIHSTDAPRLEGVKANRFVDEATTLSPDLRIVETPGKTRGEVGLLFRNALILGDTVIGHPAGEIGLLPDAKIEDKPALLATLARIPEFSFEILLLGDGESVLDNPKEKIRSLLASPRTIPIGR